MDLTGGNPVNYKGYPEKVKALQEKTGLKKKLLSQEKENRRKRNGDRSL